MDKRKIAKLKAECGEDIGIVYRKGSSIYFEKPKFMHIKKFVYDKENDTFVAIMKRRWWWTSIVLFIALCGLLYYTYTFESPVQTIQYQKKVIIDNGIMGLNITNPESNKYPIYVSFYLNGEQVTDNYKLEVGENVGNINTGAFGLSEGSHPMKLRVIIGGGTSKQLEREYDVVVIVKE